jgi:hypothetical protein
MTRSSSDVSVISCELDSHADTCCGSQALLLSEDLLNWVDVTMFMSNLGTVSNVPIVSIAVAYDCANSYQTYILYFSPSVIY